MNRKHFYTAIILLSLLAIGIQPALASSIQVPSQTEFNGTTIAEYSGGIYKLVEDVPETLFIEQSDLIVDGDGHEITPGSSTGVGVDINGKNGITVRNLTITGFQIGIWLQNSNLGPAEPKENVLENNTISGSTDKGIYLYTANGTTLTGNNISNCYWGIHLLESGNTDVWPDPPYSTFYDYNNKITNNTVTGNAGGIWLQNSIYNTVSVNTVTGQTAAGIYLSVQSNNNTITGNNSSNNRDGINLNGVSNNTITGNTASNNEYGIKLLDSSNNILNNNTVENNTLYGIFLDPSIDNQINNNNFITNATQAYVADDSIDNNFDGNYWSDWGGSGSYVILSTPSQIEVKDNSPYAEPDGWIVDTIPPEITCPGDITIEAMEPEGVPIDDDRIQTFLAGVSATDNCDPPEDIVITNDAPSMFPPGDTIVTFTATDTSDNSSTCQSTVTVVEAVESSLRIIPRIINREGRLQNILAVIRFPAGTTEEDIDINTPLVLYPGESPDGVIATSQQIVTWYRCGTLRVAVFARFPKDDVTAGVPEDGQAEMMVIGRYMSGQYFYGFDNVWICSWSW